MITSILFKYLKYLKCIMSLLPKIIVIPVYFIFHGIVEATKSIICSFCYFTYKYYNIRCILNVQINSMPLFLFKFRKFVTGNEKWILTTLKEKNRGLTLVNHQPRNPIIKIFGMHKGKDTKLIFTPNIFKENNFEDILNKMFCHHVLFMFRNK